MRERYEQEYYNLVEKRGISIDIIVKKKRYSDIDMFLLKDKEMSQGTWGKFKFYMALILYIKSRERQKDFKF